MYSPGQVSEFLEIPSSTLRHYAKVYSIHLSAGANKRRRQYTDSDLQTLEKVKKLSADGKTINEIKQHLGETIVVEKESESDSALALIPALQNLDTRMINLEKMGDDQRDIKNELTEIRQTQSEILALLQQQNKPSFWDRILRRMPE